MGRPLSKKYFGDTNTANIAGEGLLSVGINAAGSYTSRPTITISAPDLPSGTQAAASVISTAVSAVVGGTPTNFTTGDIITITKAGGSASFTVTDNGSGGIASVAVLDGGTWGALTGTATYTVTGPAPGYNPGGASGTAASATLTLTFQAASVEVTTAGSGYIAAPTVTSGGSVTYNAITLTSTNVNGIIAYAYTGASREIVDIVKQQSSRRYKVTGAGGTVRSAVLVAKASDSANEMDITATDSHSNEYWVLKITSRKALIVRKNPAAGEFVTGTSGIMVRWTTGSAVDGVSVKIQNA